MFAVVRITAIAVLAKAMIDDDVSSKTILTVLGILAVSVLGQFLISLKTTMLQMLKIQ